MILEQVEDPVKDSEYENTHFNILKGFKNELFDIRKKTGIKVYELINMSLMNYLEDLENMADYDPEEVILTLENDYILLKEKIEGV